MSKQPLSASGPLNHIINVTSNANSITTFGTGLNKCSASTTTAVT